MVVPSRRMCLPKSHGFQDVHGDVCDVRDMRATWGRCQARSEIEGPVWNIQFYRELQQIYATMIICYSKRVTLWLITKQQTRGSKAKHLILLYIYILFGDFCLLKCDHMFFLWDRIGYNQHTMGIPSYTLRVIKLGWQGNPWTHGGF